MPSIAAHMTIAKLLSEKLDIEDEDFYRGNLLPDVIKTPREESHFKVQGEHFLVPNLEVAKKSLALTESMYLGYYTHLLLDKYFLEEFIPTYIGRYDLFKTKEMYLDYDEINLFIVNTFNLDVETITKILSENYVCDIDQEKLEKNISCLNKEKNGEGIYLKREQFRTFLEEVSNKIYDDVKVYTKKTSNK